MTFINDAPDDVRERLRAEILGNVEARRDEAQRAFSFLVNFMGIVLSGGTIAILGFLGQRSSDDIPILGVASFTSFGVSLLSFSLFLYLHYQLHVARWNYYADVAQGWFLRDNSMEELLEAMSHLQSKWLFRLMFWVPFGFAVLGFVLAAAATVTPWSEQTVSTAERPAEMAASVDVSTREVLPENQPGVTSDQQGEIGVE